MADPENKVGENAEGGFLADEECIDCDPCREAMEGCPVEAIGDDG